MTRQVSYAKALRMAHEHTARAFAEREALRVAGNLAAEGEDYLDRMHRQIKEMVRTVNRDHHVPTNLDALMEVYALGAFLERFDEITGSAGYPIEAANDRRQA